MAKSWRLILDEHHQGPYNMATDEAILACYSLKKIPTLRIYGWHPPCISLGYNQQAKDVLFCEEAFPFVRRITGGAGILHDKELTYSITCSLADIKLPKGVKESFRVLCSFLIDFYAQLNLKAQFAREAVATRTGHYGNFCFSSCEEFDLVIAGKKIGGNAQRRKKDIIFQHGSIPLEIDFTLIKGLIRGSEAACDRATALIPLLHQKKDFYSLRSLLAKSFTRSFNLELASGGLYPEEETIRDSLISEKYKMRRWNVSRIYQKAHSCEQTSNIDEETSLA
ncbi:MAG: lipoate--protein ligase family protein [Candidatus Omnitrophica bacterium]|nr:lipoate--protein ligase family protein [Candidatus Omnitrophota bacterium]